MKILLVGGGTLGPVTPLLALHDHWQARVPGEHAFLFVGTPGGPEAALVREVGIEFVAVRGAKLDRFFSPRLLVAPLLFVWSFIRAIGVVARFRPSVMVCAGAYLGVPFAYAARFLGVPVVLHQLDLAVGLSNRLMAPVASAVAVAVPELAAAFPGKAVVTGIPVRHAVMDALARRTELAAEADVQFGLSPGVPTVLIVGGGTGAAQLNALVAKTADALVAVANVIHVTGPGKSLPGLAPARYRQYPLLGPTEMAQAYAAADLVVSRAGMGAIAELAALHKPFILLPMPDSPQEENAAYFHAKAGIPVFVKGTTPEEFLKAILVYLKDPRSWGGSAERMRALLPPNAAQIIAELVASVAKK